MLKTPVVSYQCTCSNVNVGVVDGEINYKLELILERKKNMLRGRVCVHSLSLSLFSEHTGIRIRRYRWPAFGRKRRAVTRSDTSLLVLWNQSSVRLRIF